MDEERLALESAKSPRHESLNQGVTSPTPSIHRTEPTVVAAATFGSTVTAPVVSMTARWVCPAGTPSDQLSAVAQRPSLVVLVQVLSMSCAGIVSRRSGYSIGVPSPEQVKVPELV